MSLVQRNTNKLETGLVGWVEFTKFVLFFWCGQPVDTGGHLLISKSISSLLVCFGSPSLSKTSTEEPEISSYQTFPAFSLRTLENQLKDGDSHKEIKSLQVLTGLSYGHGGRKKRRINTSRC